LNKILFNHREHKPVYTAGREGAKHTKLNNVIQLFVYPLRPLWLLDFDFFNSLLGRVKKYKRVGFRVKPYDFSLKTGYS
jgi:hypothetical protein